MGHKLLAVAAAVALLALGRLGVIVDEPPTPVQGASHREIKRSFAARTTAHRI